QEEEANLTTGHQEEMVAWVAIEAGDQEDYNIMNVAEINLNHSSKTINFQNAFNSTPAILTNLQTAYEKDPATVRYNSLTTNMVNVRIAEETSLDGETNHIDERMAYWALEIADTIKDIKNNPFGESGVLPANDQWITINTVHSYTNPVVIANGLSDNDPTPAVVRVRNVTDNSFEVKVQEWAYADGNHGEEMINYVVVEGSIPLDASMICNTGTDGLIFGKDIIAIDNCDANVSLAYHEEVIIDGNTKRFIRSWYAQDECGNEIGYGQEIPCIGVGVQIKAMLQGAMLGSSESNLMRDDLRKKGLIPHKEPYSAMSTFSKYGIGDSEEELDPTLLNITGNKAIVDWVFIELMDGLNQDKVVATRSALLQRDGQIVAANGHEILYFDNLPPGNYYVCLRHRNHLNVATKHPYFFNGNTIPFIDFTYSFLPTIGTDAFVAMDNKNAMWSGDLNQNEQVIFQGPNNDIFSMFLQVLFDSLNQKFLVNYINRGYTINDFNMDGITIYQGPNNDRANLLFSTILNHPNNNTNLSNFIISTKEKVVTENIDQCLLTPEKSFCDFDNDGKLNSLDSDDDNDGVVDGNDQDPYNKFSDSDGDGINDFNEKENDSNPLNACDPYQDYTICEAQDIDGDGKFGNYPADHNAYDENDLDACTPNGQAPNCACPDNDKDGYINICQTLVSGKKQTIKIKKGTWQTWQSIGNIICGACN
ncbi:MAG: hypothetical protein AB8G86_02400, partial [Saprospiraceae bacterium]